VVGLERAGRSNCVIDAGGVFQGVLTSPFFGMPWTEANAPEAGAAQRTAAAGLRPPPLGVL